MEPACLRAAGMSVQMNMQLYAQENRPPTVTIEQLIEDHGALRTLAAFVRAVIRRNRARGLYVYELSDHVRRDVGLPPEMAHRNYWDLRR